MFVPKERAQMVCNFHRSPVFAGVVAAAAMAAAPASAAELPAFETAPSVPFAASAFDTRADVAQWGGWGGWGGGWGGGWRGRGWRRRGPSAGEVLAGVAIIGGIAAIASAASNNRRNRDVVVVDRDRPQDWNRDQRNPQWRGDDRRSNPRASGAGGLDGAVSQCLGVIERDVRVDEVQSVQRTAQGWLVGGTLFNGSGFQCRIGNDGRIENIDYGAGGGLGAASGAPGTAPAAGGQWDDNRYAAARLAAAPAQPDPEGGITMFTPPASVAANAAQPLVPLTAPRLPTYPGGPVEGEEPVPLVQRPGIPR
jgi:hypothetical protein